MVFDKNYNALYFSKELIPFFNKKYKAKRRKPCISSCWSLCYRSDTLLKYNSWKESNLEVLEGLEQLRFLENACSIKCVIVDSRGRTFWELNNPEDVLRIEKVLMKINTKRTEKMKTLKILLVTIQRGRCLPCSLPFFTGEKF